MSPDFLTGCHAGKRAGYLDNTLLLIVIRQRGMIENQKIPNPTDRKSCIGPAGYSTGVGLSGSILTGSRDSRAPVACSSLSTIPAGCWSSPHLPPAWLTVAAQSGGCSSRSRLHYWVSEGSRERIQHLHAGRRCISKRAVAGVPAY